MTNRETLIEVLNNSFEKQYEKRGLLTAHHTATDLIANGVTFATDTNDGGKWISVKDRLPTKEDAKIMGEYLPAIEKAKKPSVWKWTEVAKHPEYFTHWYALPEPPKGE